mgnify:FL=1
MDQDSKLPQILLASVSPRRRQLLEALGIPFQIRNPNCDEVQPSVSDVHAGILKNAAAKAQSILANVSDAATVVVAADTLVMVQNRILGKPRDKEDARQLLALHSVQTHTVLTGLALASKKFGERTAVDETRVTFRKLSDTEIESYLTTKEPYDKAGAYAVQGLGALFIHQIEGSYTNVMGFPLELFLRELGALTHRSPHEWFL